MKNIFKRKDKKVEDSDSTPAAPSKKEKGGKKQRKEPGLKKQKKVRVFLGNVKIAPKLLAAFLIIALMGAAMGIYAVINLKSLNTSSRQLYVNVLLPTKNITSVMASFDSECINLRQALLNDDDLYTSAYISNINGAQKTIDSQLSLIESLLPEQSKEAFAQLKADYGAYEQLMSEAVSRIEANDKETLRQSLLNGDLKEAEKAVKASFDEILISVNANAAAASTANTKTADSVFLITLIAVGVVLAFSVTIGISMALGINRPIKKLTADAKRLAAGEVDIDTGGRSTKDEIGQIRDAFNKILQVIRELTQDTDMLISAAAQGELSVRADAQKHEGAYRKIVEGMNATLDATVTPIVEAAGALGELANGNLNVSVEGDFAGDFAILKNAFNSTVETLKGYIAEISTVMEHIAEGRLDSSIVSEYKGDFIALKEAINRTIASFNGVLRELDTAAEEVAVGTLQLSSGSQTISQGATEQAGALEQLNASLAELSGDTTNNAERAGQTNEISMKAKEYAVSGNEKMKALQAAMRDINEASANISKIIKVIDDIAFQTNILALNAAIEAARAGEHGKGFAVVADEVRNLAARSANAAKETTELIESSIQKTAAGTKIADDTAHALLEIVGGVEQTVALSGEIASASRRQATSIDQVGKGIEQLSVVVQTNSATAEEAAASSEELSSQADSLKNMVKRFQLQASDAGEPAPGPQASPALQGDGWNSVRLNDTDFGKY